MKLSIKILLAAFTAVLFNSCSKSLLDIDAPHVMLADNLYVNKEGFEAGLNGLYDEVRRMRSGNNYKGNTGFMLGMAYVGVDNAYSNYPGGPETVFNTWGAINNPSFVAYPLVWAWLYETINAANTIINRAKNPKIEWTENEKNIILAEAKCIRAWCYRHLTYLWGDVPLTFEESQGTSIKTDWQRAPIAEVRDSMEADWRFAEEYLPEISPNDGKVIKGVAQHYLAELYLAEGRPDLAKTEAEKVTQNAKYALITSRYGVAKDQPGTPYTDMFLDGNSNRSDGNTEVLWVLPNEINVIGGEGYNIMFRFWGNRYEAIKVGGKNPMRVSADYGGRSLGRFGYTKYAFSIYPPGDDRGSSFNWRFYWIINNPNGIPAGYQLGDTIFLNTSSVEKAGNPAWPITRKWDYANQDNPNSNTQYNDQIYLRSADTWLLLAEANLALHDNEGAADAINALRRRAHAPEVDPEDVTLDLILDERSRELITEEERRYTLLRTRTWLERTTLYNNVAKDNIAARDTLFPIPLDVINANLTTPMRQNEGYQ